MSFAEQMLAGVNLMALGMGIVFSFLIVLVFALKAMSMLARLLQGPEKGHAVQAGAPVSPTPDGELLAVISAAISRFRSRNNP